MYSYFIMLLSTTISLSFFFFNDTATTEIYTLSLHDALPICAEVGRIRDTGFLQVSLGALRHPARIAPIRLPAERIDGIPDHYQCRGVAERVQERRRRIGDQQHVRFVDGSPSANGAGVETETILEAVLL